MSDNPNSTRLRSLPQVPFLSWLRHRWMAHGAFWLCYTSFFALMSQEPLGSALGYELIMLPVKMLVTYAVLYWLIPQFFLSGHYAGFFSLALILLAVGGISQRVVIFYGLYPMLYPGEFTGSFSEPYTIVRNTVSIFTVTVLASAIKITRFWFEDHEKTMILREEKLQTELKFLKAQIHPHFLFNTLNNLYSLTLQQSPAAPEVVLRLSGLMSYLLHDASADLVPLSREIETLRDYIALERIRHGDSLDLSVDIGGPLEGVHIAPLLLIPFVENSFKHGIGEAIGTKWVTISLLVKGEEIVFKVENSHHPHLRRHKSESGIGLSNVRRRLELLYPARHELHIFEEEDSFLITLRINSKRNEHSLHDRR